MKEPKNTIKVKFGPSRKPLKEQLDECGVRCSNPAIFEALANAVLILGREGILPVKEALRAYDEIGNRLNADVNACMRQGQ